MGPKPVAGDDQTGFSPDDRNSRTELCQHYCYICHNIIILGYALIMIIVINQYSNS